MRVARALPQVVSGTAVSRLVVVAGAVREVTAEHRGTRGRVVVRRPLLVTFAVDEILADSRRVVTAANTVDYFRCVRLNSWPTAKICARCSAQPPHRLLPLKKNLNHFCLDCHSVCDNVYCSLTMFSALAAVCTVDYITLHYGRRRTSHAPQLKGYNKTTAIEIVLITLHYITSIIAADNHISNVRGHVGDVHVVTQCLVAMPRYRVVHGRTRSLRAAQRTAVRAETVNKIIIIIIISATNHIVNF